MAKTPGEYARWVRSWHSLDGSGALDLDELVRRCGGRVDEMELDGCAGILLPVDGTFGIAVKQSDSRQRKRFTIAHELGHSCIPSHSKRAIHCVSPELSREATTRPAEREANEFAAELLMPRRLITPMVATGAIDIRRASDVAGNFEVSTLSAALRVCEVSRERAAVAYYRDGRLKWAFRFDMPYGLPETGTAPPDGSIANDIICGREGSVTGLVVDREEWLPLGQPDSSWGDLLESSIQLDGSGEILSVLWLTEAE